MTDAMKTYNVKVKRIAEKDIEAIVDKHIKKEYSLRKSTALAGDTQTFEIALSGKNARPPRGYCHPS